MFNCRLQEVYKYLSLSDKLEWLETKRLLEENCGGGGIRKYLFWYCYCICYLFATYF